MKYIISNLLATLAVTAASAQVTFNVNVAEHKAPIGDLHYGIFYEEINHAGDGGLYAELIRNRSFEDSKDATGWSTVGGATISIASKTLMNDAQQQYLHLTTKKAGDGISNEGFWGMKFVGGEDHKLTFWVRSDKAWKGTLTATLRNEKDEVTGTADINVKADKMWQKVTATIRATGSASKGHFTLTASKAAQLDIDVVSLFPPTFRGHENGLRRDLAQLLADLNPKFIRFPGGCYIEGQYRDGRQNRFEWKKTIGGIETRPGHYNVNWNYRVTDGLGFHELLQLCEDLNAAPLFVVNIGLGHGWQQHVDSLDEYVQEALDALEYANGPVTSKYGAMRAANGHPAPFNIRLIEVGNENEGMDHYEQRFAIFRKAILAKYPDMKLIADGTKEMWQNSTIVADACDEHYYTSPGWFENNYDKYTTADRTKSHRVYVGEYAVTQEFGTTGNLAAALGEAAFMEGMENNSDLVRMCSYAPIFTHESDYHWRPDMIRFDASMSYGTPSYYTQRLMANYVGKDNVAWTEANNIYKVEHPNHRFGFSSWGTSAQYSNVKITLPDGKVLTPLTDDNASKWTSKGGKWELKDGTYTQTDRRVRGRLNVFDEELGDKYTIDLDAKKIEGDEGFMIVFNESDPQNFIWWNIGGWNNHHSGIEITTCGSRSTFANSKDIVRDGQTYHAQIVVDGKHVKCLLDGQLSHEFDIPESTARHLFFASSVDDAAGKLYIKVVNPFGTKCPAQINLKGAKANGARLITLQSSSDQHENTHDDPYHVAPREQGIDLQGSSFVYDAPAYSLSILEIKIK